MRFPKILDYETMHKVATHEDRIQMLEDHKKLCDEMHDISKDHRKRSDDAMNNLTQSNILLAQSIDSMNQTISEIVRDDRPVVRRSKIFQQWWDRFVNWVDVNKTLGKVLLGILLTAAGVVTALKTLGWW